MNRLALVVYIICITAFYFISQLMKELDNERILYGFILYSGLNYLVIYPYLFDRDMLLPPSGYKLSAGKDPVLRKTMFFIVLFILMTFLIVY